MKPPYRTAQRLDEWGRRGVLKALERVEAEGVGLMAELRSNQILASKGLIPPDGSVRRELIKVAREWNRLQRVMSPERGG